MMEHDSALTQVALCLIASGTMISSGMNVAFPSVALPALNNTDMSNSTLDTISTQQSAILHNYQAFWIVSLPQVTMVLGCLAAGPILDWRGRRLGLVLSTFLASTGWLVMAMLPNLWCIYLGRLLTGLAMGLASPSVSVFVSEIASPSTRSALTIIKIVAFSFGLALTYFFGYLFRTDWRLVSLLCGLFPITCLLLVLSYIPEPKIWTNRIPRHNLNFFRPEVIKPMTIMSLALFLRQLSGTSAILSYAVEMVGQAGVMADVYLVAVMLGLTRILGGFFAVWLSSRLGRRLPATWSGVAMSASMLALASSFEYPGYALLVYIFTSTVHGAIPQAMVAEVFPTDVRGIATSCTTVMIYVTSFVALGVHQWLRLDKSVMFTYYGTLSVISTLYIILFLPETHGKTLNQIQHIFNKKLGEDIELKYPLDPKKNTKD